MGKYYTQTTAALNAVTIDTAKLDAQNILIYPGEGDRESRINVAESLKSVSNLDAAIFGEEVARTYNSADIPTNHTLDGANITAIRLSRRHCVSGKVNTIKIPYAGATMNVTAYLSVQVFLDNTTSYIKYSDNTQTQANGTSGESVFTFTDFTLPNEYKFIQLCFVTSKTSVPDVSNNTGNTGFRVRIVKNSDASNELEWDDDDCGLYANLTYKNWISQVIIDYTLTRGLVGQVSDINDSITEIHELLKNVGPSDDCALKSADNTFTATNTFNGSTVFNGSSRFQTGPYDVTINQSGLWSYYPVTSEMGFVTEGALSVAPLGVQTALGTDAYALRVSKSEGIQLWGTHFMQGDEWSDNALKIVHNELALFGNHQAPCSLTFDNANVVNFKVMPDDGSTANNGQGAIFDFQGWQWDNDSHTSKNANCPVQILKNNAGELVDRSLLNKSELDARYAQLHSENTLTETNTFEKTLIAEDGINATSGDIVVSEGVITFEDLIDGTVVERSGATGYQYVEGMPTSFENGVCYDIGEISNTTNLSNVKFTAEGRLVQTCELWFKTPATVPTTHKWPTNIYWIDSATGAAPTLIASKNYRLVFRQEPNKIIASIAYLY